ncbi:MAG TPA: hypothetical protein DCL61_08055, partial [Cyanobacteria bacterium UBA12227]|nr:hypothetical protein [Cyanobacteria bacterium UBA12227]
KFVTTSEQKGDKEDKEDKGEILGGELFPSCCTSTHDNAFFPEWLDNLPPITDFEKQQLDRVKRSYISRVERHPLSENLVKMNSIKSSVSSKNWVN